MHNSIKLIVRNNGDKFEVQNTNYYDRFGDIYPYQDEINELVESQAIAFDDLDQIIEMINEY